MYLRHSQTCLTIRDLRPISRKPLRSICRAYFYIISVLSNRRRFYRPKEKTEGKHTSPFKTQYQAEEGCRCPRDLKNKRNVMA